MASIIDHSQVTLDVSCVGSCYLKTDPTELKVSILSLLCDHYIPGEIILVVDGPIASELQIMVDSLAHSFDLKIIENIVNIGLGASLAKACLDSSFDLILRYDTDDISMPGRIHKQYLFMLSHPSISCCGSSVIELSPLSDDLYVQTLKSVPLSSNAIENNIYFRNPLNHPSVILRKSHLISVGNYQHILFFEDYYLWLRFINCGFHLMNIKEPLVYMRRPSLVARRSGLHYFICEIRFACVLLKHSNLYLLAVSFFILIRALFRLLLPSFLLRFIPWRSSNPGSNLFDLAKFSHTHFNFYP